MQSTLSFLKLMHGHNRLLVQHISIYPEQTGLTVLPGLWGTRSKEEIEENSLAERFVWFIQRNQLKKQHFN